MRRRMGRPGLVGTMARTAVIAGTAQAVSGSVQQKQMAKANAAQQAAAQDQQTQAQLAEMQAQLAALPTQPVAAPAAAAAAPSGGGDLIAQLEKLASLKAAGILTDEEFSAAKATLLA